MDRIRRRGFVSSFGPVGLAVSLLQSASASSGRQFSSGINLVEVYATVTDKSGESVTGLSRSQFHVSEDGRPQAIVTFTSAELPLSVALAIDRSWSMAGEHLTTAAAAARRFLTELRPADRAMIIAIGSQVEVVAPLSVHREEATAVIDGLEPWGTTSLHDAIIAAIDHIQPAEGRRALILLSDGSDRYSTARASDAVARVRSADVLVYPIALGRERPALFAELAVTSGGRSFHLRDMATLGSTLTLIARELRLQYLIGYTPSRPIDPGAPEWRSIRVTVDRPGIQVRARDGYLAR